MKIATPGLCFFVFALVAALFISHASAQENPDAFAKIAEKGYCPFWTPDGSSIVFGSTGREANNVWSVSLSDKVATRLTEGGGYHPTVSPDGKYVSYDDRGAYGRIFKMPTGGGDPVMVTPNSVEGNFSYWSPDGSAIVFNSRGDIWRVSSEGSDLARVTSMESDVRRPAFSPDGRKIAFDAADKDASGNRDIWVFDAASSTYTRLTETRGMDVQPHWSPDGTRLAFMSERNGNRDVWIMKADGSEAVQVTFDRGMDVWPRWSPDGKKLAFGSDRSGSMDIWIVDLEKQLRD